MTAPRWRFRACIAACVVGTIVPYVALGSFVARHGLDLARMWDQATANAMSAFAWLDVLVSAVVVIVAAVVRGRAGMRGWGWPVLGTCLVGVSLGLPLLLAMHLRSTSARS